MNQSTFIIFVAQSVNKSNWIMKFLQILIIFATIFAFVTCRKILYIKRKHASAKNNSSISATMLKSPNQGVKCDFGFLHDRKNNICRRAIIWIIHVRLPKSNKSYKYMNQIYCTFISACLYEQYLISCGCKTPVLYCYKLYYYEKKNK